MNFIKVKIKDFKGELPSYLTFGKEYRVFSCDKEFGIINLGGGHLIRINYIRDCNHLNGGSWEIVE